MANIEILAYCPINMDDFLFFCVNGAPDGKGSWLPDIYGRKKTGVFDWLYGREVPEAHFYTSLPEDRAPLFAATVFRPESGPMPWTKNIPGFEDLLVKDGLVRLDGQFPAPDLPLATLRRRPDLDDQFVAGRAKVKEVLDGLQARGDGPFNIQAFRAALRGEAGTDLASLTADLRSDLNLK